MNIYDRNTGTFRRMPGPVFTNLLLADHLEQYYFSAVPTVENREEPDRIRAHLKTSLQNKNV